MCNPNQLVTSAGKFCCQYDAEAAPQPTPAVSYPQVYQMVVMISPVAAPSFSLRSAMPAFSPRRSSIKTQRNRGQQPTRLPTPVSASSQPEHHNVRDGDPECQRDTAASRRELLFSATAVSSIVALSTVVQPAAAVQGITAGRLPGAIPWPVLCLVVSLTWN